MSGCSQAPKDRKGSTRKPAADPKSDPSCRMETKPVTTLPAKSKAELATAASTK